MVSVAKSILRHVYIFFARVNNSFDLKCEQQCYFQELKKINKNNKKQTKEYRIDCILDSFVIDLFLFLFFVCFLRYFFPLFGAVICKFIVFLLSDVK